ncbi:MAG: PIN domain-containing protein [Rhodopirellula sp.]|nr:PIN domain-containing protein [Rhodopirellula sp.]
MDANVWLALAVDAHVHHISASTWFDGQREGSCAFCRLTQLAILRHLTNARIMGEANVQTQAQAWRVYEALVTDPRVEYLDEPPGIIGPFESLTQASQPAQKRWSDALLAAFAMCLGLEVVTFDAGFKSFSGLSVRLPSG